MLIYGLNQIADAAKTVIRNSGDKKLWCFYGEMGSGKTTLIKEICKQLGVVDNISSPTFSLVNEYKTNQNFTIFHFDFYRIKTLEEVYDIGYEDYFFSNHICLIEWPEMVEKLLPPNLILKLIVKQNKMQRELLVQNQ